MASLLVGQTRAALSSSASQHLAAVGGSHSPAEAVLLSAPTLLGLECSLHDAAPPVSFVSYSIPGHPESVRAQLIQYPVRREFYYITNFLVMSIQKFRKRSVTLYYSAFSRASPAFMLR